MGIDSKSNALPLRRCVTKCTAVAMTDSNDVLLCQSSHWMCYVKTLMNVPELLETAAENTESVMDSVHLDHTPAPVTKDTHCMIRKMNALVSFLLMSVTRQKIYLEQYQWQMVLLI